MKLLALDLSTKSSGYCFGEDKKILESGYVVADSKNPVERIVIMRNKIAAIIQEKKVDKIIMQQVLPDFNSHTNKILTWLQAAIVIAAYEINSKIQYDFIITSQWRERLKIKQGPGIRRQILKNEDIKYVKDRYNIIVNDDQADAICIFDAYFKQNESEINWE